MVSLYHSNRDLIAVLYSLEYNTWQIGDFGLTVAGTSAHPITTKEAKGTNCYRAPELLREDSKYNNKVDIWAIGCIVYELATQQMAFRNDFDTREAASLSEFKTILPEAVIDESPRRLISRLVNTCLNVEPKERPTAKTICSWLREYLGLDPGVTEPPSSIKRKPLYSGISHVLLQLMQY